MDDDSASTRRPRAQFWDERLSGFGVAVGRSRRSFVARTYVKGTRVRRYVTLGHWAPSKLRAAEAATTSSSCC